MRGDARGPILVARGLAKRYARRDVLAGASLALAPGEVAAVLGANGAGKSTLLRLLASVERPDAGTVEILGVDAVEDGARARRAVGFVGHAPGLYPSLTVRENLDFALAYRVPDRGERARRLAAAADAFGLARALDERAGALSRGTLQRAALARAFAPEPALLVLDEPWTGLDEDASAALDAAVAAAAARGAAVVASTHDAARAARVATRRLAVADGLVREAAGAVPA